MANTFEYAKLFETNLDKLAIQTLKTGFMDGNSGQVIYTGGNEVKIPKLSLNGMGDYSRENGYTKGSINLTYQTMTMTQDRGRQFTIDAMDVDETSFIATASNIMGEFQRTRVVPEIDAYRISKLSTIAMATEGQAEYGYSVSNSDIITKIKKGIQVIRENSFDTELIILASYDTKTAIEEAVLGKLTSGTFSQGGIDTRVPYIDDCPIIAVPKTRMYTAITLNDGSTSGQEDGLTSYNKGNG